MTLKLSLAENAAEVIRHSYKDHMSERLTKQSFFLNSIGKKPPGGTKKFYHHARRMGPRSSQPIDPVYNRINQHITILQMFFCYFFLSVVIIRSLMYAVHKSV